MAFPDTFRLLSPETIVQIESAPYVAKEADANFEDGEWAEFDVDGVTLKLNGAEAPLRAVCITRGTRYPDTANALGGLGHLRNTGWEADTKQFDAQGAYAVGTKLAAKAGVLTPSVQGEYYVAEVVIPPAKHPVEVNVWMRIRAIVGCDCVTREIL